MTSCSLQLRRHAWSLGLVALLPACASHAASAAAEPLPAPPAIGAAYPSETMRSALLDAGDFSVDYRHAPAEEPTPAEGGDLDRQMVYRARFALEWVARPDAAIDAFLVQVRAWDGHLAVRRDGEVTCRVPAARFDTCVAHVRGLGRVRSELIEAEDVTRQHRDLGLRLHNARTSRERLLALLERAEEMDDILQIENELRRLTDEIESMEAELRALDDRIALATVTVDFRATARAAAAKPARSRFAWIRAMGVEHVERAF